MNQPADILTPDTAVSRTVSFRIRHLTMLAEMQTMNGKDLSKTVQEAIEALYATYNPERQS